MAAVNKEYQHPLVIRLTHWVNFISLAIMVMSGWKIYNASPLFGFEFPPIVTIGGWLAGARQWHFFAMWLFVINGTVWVAYNILSRHGRKTTLFLRGDVSGVLPMVQYYLRLRKEHPPATKYNSLQKLAYTTIPIAALGIILTGIGIYWPVQFAWLTAIFRGYEGARILHFFFMVAIVSFFLGHIMMVVFAGWNNFVSILTWWKKKEAAG